MGLRIKTNVTALKSQRQMATNNRNLQASMERLASGLRINRSADDAAGLAVSERIRGRVRSLDVAKRNANDGISYIQVAEGGLNEVTNMVVRMRELTSQAASDTLGNTEREFLDKEFQQIRQEVVRIVDSTEFNGAKVIDPEGSQNISIFVGASNRAEGAEAIEETGVDPDVLKISFGAADGGDNTFKAAYDNLFDLGNEVAIVAGITEGDGDVSPASTLGDGSEGGTNVLLGNIDTMLNEIAGFRATLGSVQSRLNSTITNIEISNENLSAARSRIVDVDYAAESANFAQSRILTQAGLSVQLQANSYPDMALTLLR